MSRLVRHHGRGPVVTLPPEVAAEVRASTSREDLFGVLSPRVELKRRVEQIVGGHRLTWNSVWLSNQPKPRVVEQPKPPKVKKGRKKKAEPGWWFR